MRLLSVIAVPQMQTWRYVVAGLHHDSRFQGKSSVASLIVEALTSTKITGHITSMNMMSGETVMCNVVGMLRIHFTGNLSVGHGEYTS